MCKKKIVDSQQIFPNLSETATEKSKQKPSLSSVKLLMHKGTVLYRYTGMSIRNNICLFFCGIKHVLEKSLSVTSQEKYCFFFDQGGKKSFLVQSKNIIWSGIKTILCFEEHTTFSLVRE